MSAIGNFDIARPPAVRSPRAYAQLFAWKLSQLQHPREQPAGVREEPLPAGDQRPPGRRPDRLPGSLPLRQAPSIRTAAQTDPDQRPVGTPHQAPADTPPNPRLLPFTSPTQKPRCAPRSRRTSRSRGRGTWRLRVPRPRAQWAPRAGCASCRPADRPVPPESVARRAAGAPMNLITAVGDVTGDGKGDVLGRSASTGKSARLPRRRRRPRQTTGVAPTAAFQAANLSSRRGTGTRDGRNDVFMRTDANSRLWLVRGLGSGNSLRRSGSRAATGPATPPSRPPATSTGTAIPTSSGCTRTATCTSSRARQQGTLAAAKDVRAVGTRYTASWAVPATSPVTASGDVVPLEPGRRHRHPVRQRRRRLRRHTRDVHRHRSLNAREWARMAGSSHPDVVGSDATGTQARRDPAATGCTNVHARWSGPTSPFREPRRCSPRATGTATASSDLVTREDGGDKLLLRLGQGQRQFAAGRADGQRAGSPFTVPRAGR